MSYKYIFKAEIFPHRVDFNCNLPPEVYLAIPDDGFGVSGKIIHFSVIHSFLELHFISEYQYLPGLSDANIETLKNRIEFLIRSIVDAFCFIHSYNYELSMTSVDCPELSLNNYLFGVQGEYGHMGDKYTLEKIIVCYHHIGEKTHHLVSAFTDFRLSIKYPDATAQYCLRSLETIRRGFFDDISIENNDKRDKEGWEKMAKNLYVTKEECMIFERMRKDFAQFNRHGVYPLITYTERKDFMKITRSILQKFIDSIIG